MILNDFHCSDPKLDCVCECVTNKTLSRKLLSRQFPCELCTLHKHEFKSVRDPLGDVDGADHHLGLQLLLLRPILLHPSQNFNFWWVQFNLPLSLPLILSICPDFGLFLFDVVSDILNGVNFIKEGNPIWGWGVIGRVAECHGSHRYICVKKWLNVEKLENFNWG